MLTAAQLRTLIITEVGDVDGLIQGQIETLWTLHDETDLYLQYVLTKRSAIDMLMGKVREQVNLTGDNGARAELSDMLKALQTMRGNVEGEISVTRQTAEQAAADTAARARRPLVGRLTARLGDGR